MLFVSTDGENGINQIHWSFGSYIESLQTDDFDDILTELQYYDHLFPVSDWLHLIKDLITCDAS